MADESWIWRNVSPLGPVCCQPDYHSVRRQHRLVITGTGIHYSIFCAGHDCKKARQLIFPLAKVTLPNLGLDDTPREQVPSFICAQGERMRHHSHLGRKGLLSNPYMQADKSSTIPSFSLVAHHVLHHINSLFFEDYCATEASCHYFS